MAASMVVDLVKANFSILNCIVALVSLCVIHAAAVAFYRLNLHPLANFPGPKLAGASYLYEFWFDVVLQGRYTRQIVHLHEIYGPLVRINPNEIHCNDPNFVDTVYSHGKGRRNKSQHYLAAMPWGLRLASVGTADHDHHRLRRSPASKYFSRSQIVKLEGMIQEKTQVLCDKLLTDSKSTPIQIAAAYSCFTTDALTSYCFGHSLGNLDQPGWNPAFKGTIDQITGLFYLSRHLQPLSYLAEIMPLSICRRLSTEIGALLELIRSTIPRLVEHAKTAHHVDCSGSSRPTIIQSLLDSDLPPTEKTPDRLVSEAIAMVLGGTHSISTVLTIATYHLLSNPSQLDRLRTELLEVAPDGTQLPSWAKLETLPYLSSVVLESLRLMHGVASRVSVVAPDEDLQYQAPWKSPKTSKVSEISYSIPRGYAVGVSAYMVHTNPELFHDASSFLPDRWLDANGQRVRGLERHILSFSKGNRQCVGMQLAYCELYIATAALALRVWPRMRLYDTELSDIAYDHDQLIAMPKANSKGVRVVVS